MKNKHEDETVIFGKRIVKLRRAKGLSQEKLADRSNMSASSISNIERGRNNVTYSTLIDLAKGLKMDISQLVDENYLPQMSSPELAEIVEKLSKLNYRKLKKISTIIDEILTLSVIYYSSQIFSVMPRIASAIRPDI